MEIINNNPAKFNNKIVTDYDKLEKVTKALRELGYRIVITIGSWDLLHIGHVRYLNKAKSFGDVLIVGADTDRAIKAYKGPLRPIVPEEERLEMLSYQSCIDLVTVVDDTTSDGKWQYGLIKKIHPEVFVAVEDSYPQNQLDDIKQCCQELIVLPRQAKNTSTSRLVQVTLKKHLINMLDNIGEA